MSQNQSACIPPPSDYAPKTRHQQPTRSRDRGSRGGRGGYNRFKQGQHGAPSFQKDKLTIEDRLKNQPKDKFHHNEEDDYFAHVEDDEEEEEKERSLDGIDDAADNDDDNEDDPLDAYMKSLEGNEEGAKTKSLSSSQNNSIKDSGEEQEVLGTTGQDIEKKGIRLDIDDSDDIEESYYQFVEQNRGKKPIDQDDAEDLMEKQNMVEYDKDGNVLSVKKIKREIEPLPSIDHSKITYQNFDKIFYKEHSEIEKLTQEQGEELRAKLDIKVSGDLPPKPVCSFAHFKFDEQLMKVIRRSEYTQPTPIQAQAIPAALLGRNIIGIAMTGSGKTAAYLWPMIVHIMGQPDLSRGDGPIALVLVPTRELALQVYGEAKKFSHSYKIAVVCAYGGGSKYEQSKDLEAGAEIVVATPGRLIDLIKLGVTNLRRVTYLVLDEADRFFEMGFEVQVRSICDHIRPDRQTLLFSATFKKKIEQLARTVTNNPVKIVQRALGEANEDVTQHVVVLAKVENKWDWLISKLVEFTSAGSVLVFVTRIVNSEELHNNLKNHGKETLLLHGDMEQSERNRVITSFKRKEMDIMIATDVAARGLDIAHVRTVINYDAARDIDTHIHRVGRTGRAGSKGDAYTLLTEKDKEFAGHLVKNLKSSNQKLSEELMKLAAQSHNFRKSRGSKNHKSHGSSNSYQRESQHDHHHHHHHHHSSHDFGKSEYRGEKRHYEGSSAHKQQNYSHRHHQRGHDRSPHRGSGSVGGGGGGGSGGSSHRDSNRSEPRSSSSSSSAHYDRGKRSRYH